MRSLNPFDHIKNLEARIEVLETALRKIIEATGNTGRTTEIARAALIRTLDNEIANEQRSSNSAHVERRNG